MSLFGPLYNIDNFKGKISCLILVAFKLLLPVMLVVVSERNESQSYKAAMLKFYKVTLTYGNYHAAFKPFLYHKNFFCEKS